MRIGKGKLVGVVRAPLDLPALRISTLGFLANVLGLLASVLVLYLCLALFGLIFNVVDELARARAMGIELPAGTLRMFITNTMVGGGGRT